jgi:hypothetical protein
MPQIALRPFMSRTMVNPVATVKTRFHSCRYFTYQPVPGRFGLPGPTASLIPMRARVEFAKILSQTLTFFITF